MAWVARNSSFEAGFYDQKTSTYITSDIDMALSENGVFTPQLPAITYRK